MGKIRGARCRVITLERGERFVIATGASSSVQNVLVMVEADGLEGIGVACPNSVTGESVDSILRFLEANLPRLRGLDPGEPSQLHEIIEPRNRQPAALCGVDGAIHDLWGKLEGVPTSRLLGGKEECIQTSVTIGIMDMRSTVDRALDWVSKGFGILKLKVGLDLKEDIEKIRRVREAVGDNIVIRVDCNQGYTSRNAIRLAEEIEPLDIEFIEQPVDAGSVESLASVSKASPVPIMADECVWTHEDARRVGEAGVKLINLKLAKCGGILPALEISRVCGEMGMDMMVGCMSECQASIAAGLHLALSQPRVRYADLDSFLSLGGDPTRAVEVREGRLFARSLPGFGITMVDR